MTLIVAGYDNEEIFFISDSAITDQEGKRLLSGFKKVYSVPIILHKPYFVRTFKRYFPFESYSGECVFALAGSTLVAQHVINTINEHLRKIRIIHEYHNGNIKYSLIRHCDITNNPMYRSGYREYDDDLYKDYLIEKDIDISDILKIIEYSVNEAFKSAIYHATEKTWNTLLNNEYLLALYCHKTKQNYLYKLSLVEYTNDENLLKIRCHIVLIPKSDIAIIGTTKFNDQITNSYASFKQNVHESNVPQKMLILLSDIIATANTGGDFGISRPIIYKTFNERLNKNITVTRDNKWYLLDEDEIAIQEISNNII
ncbi:hypothetical protein MWMV8_MWMV8_00821 [Acinetobacter calcoaceticus]|nr:hypothetical protein MWMV8_MWMV8_00821 [Acinetobacter calcoaceticus]